MCNIFSINTEQFDETINYEGSKESSFLAKLYLHIENFDFEGEVFYMVSNEEYKMILETFKEDLIEELKSFGYNIGYKNPIGVVDGILVRANGILEGGADKRGEDIAVGF